ncbi:MAG: Arm DNA-binding domain-containing protein, partial [Burkholderiales bacterium]
MPDVFETVAKALQKTEALMETAALIHSENTRTHGAERPNYCDQKNTKKCKPTDRYVASIVPPTRGQETHYDTLIECFGVHVGYGGAKTWNVQHRVETFAHKTGAHKRVARRFKLGRYPVMTLEAARKGAREALMLIAEGKDPKREQDLEQEARRVEQRDSFGHIRERFLAEYEGRRRRLKSKTRRDYTRILRTLFPD